MSDSQSFFLNTGGIFANALDAKRKSGELAKDYVYREYPKMLRISQGIKDVECSTETIRGKLIEWTEKREIFDEVVVNSEDEEERVLSGGKTSAQTEEERQGLIVRCRNEGIRVDPTWSAVRLRRELGDKLDEAPADEMGALEKKLADLRKMAEMRDEIARLTAELAAPKEEPKADPEEAMRSELRELGVKVDGRWNAVRLREELDRATQPAVVA